MNVKAPEGLLRQAQDAAATGRARQRISQDRRAPKTRRAKKSCGARTSISTISRSSSAGRTTAGASSRCPACTRAIRVSGKRNIGMYRMQVYDGQTTGMHWQRQKVAAEHYREALRDGSFGGRNRPKPDGPKRCARGHDGRVGRRRGQHSRRADRTAAACRRSRSAT